MTTTTQVTMTQTATSGPGFVLASLLAAYPDNAFSENVRVLLDDMVLRSLGSDALNETLAELRAKVYPILGSDDALDDVRSEYIDLFDRGRQINTLYETEYGRERTLVKATELVDIAAFYRAFGFETGGDGVQAEMIDHVSVELEFYALLVLKSDLLSDAGDAEGESIVLDARRKFLKSHLGRFVGAICERPGVSESPYFSSVFKFCRDLTLSECERLGVTVEPETWISTKAETGDISCGGSVGCVK